jgi:transcriptional regulator with XRE-family HTH domain
MVLSELSKKLRLLRNEKGITQEELGKLFDLAKQSISGYETGDNDPPIDTLVKLADFYNVSLDWLLGKTIVRTPIETIAAHRSDDYHKELPEDQQQDINDYIKMKINQHRKRQGLPPLTE